MELLAIDFTGCGGKTGSGLRVRQPTQSIFRPATNQLHKIVIDKSDLYYAQKQQVKSNFTSHFVPKNLNKFPKNECFRQIFLLCRSLMFMSWLHIYGH